MEGVTYRPAVAADADILCGFWLALMREHEAMDPRLVLAEDAGIRWKNDYYHWLEDTTCKIMVAVDTAGPA